MKLTKAQINQIIEEEMRAVLKEGVLGTFKGAFPPLGNANAFVKRFAGKGVHDTTIMESDLWSFFSALDRVTNEKVRKEIIELTGWQFERLNLMRGYVGRTMTLPKSIGYFSNIEEMVIAGHSFKTIPDSFENLVNLKKLNLANNEIEKLPWFLVKHPSLKKVELIGNPIRKELVEKRSEWLKQFEPKKKGLPQDPLGWGAMGEWLQDVDYWTTKGADLIYGAPEPEEDALDILGATPEERAEAEEDLEAEMENATIDLKNRMTFMRAMYGMPLKPKKAKKLSPEVKQKIVDLEIKANEIAQEIAEQAFRTKDIVMLMALGFTKEQSQGIKIGALPKELKDKDLMDMAMKSLLKGKKGTMASWKGFDFNPDKDDPPARQLDIEFLLNRTLRLGKQYKGRDAKEEDGMLSINKENLLQWHLEEIGTTGHIYFYRYVFNENRWDWTNQSVEKFDQKLYNSFIRAKALIQLKKLKDKNLVKGNFYEDQNGFSVVVEIKFNEEGLKTTSTLYYDKKNERWNIENIGKTEKYDKRANFKWVLSKFQKENKTPDGFEDLNLSDGGVFRGDFILWTWQHTYPPNEEGQSVRWTYQTQWQGEKTGWNEIRTTVEKYYDQEEQLKWMLKKEGIKRYHAWGRDYHNYWTWEDPEVHESDGKEYRKEYRTAWGGEKEGWDKIRVDHVLVKKKKKDDSSNRLSRHQSSRSRR